MEKRTRNLCVGGSSKAFRNKTAPKHSPQKRERTPVWPIRETVIVDLLLLKGTHKNHLSAMIFLSKKFF